MCTPASDDRNGRIVRAAENRRVGSLPGALYLGSADVGLATLPDGSTVYTTWGRNLDREEQLQWAQWFAARGIRSRVVVGPDGCELAELELPGDMARRLLTLLTDSVDCLTPHPTRGVSGR